MSEQAFVPMAGYRRMARVARRWWVVCFLGALVVAADQATKAVVDRALTVGESWHPDAAVRITHIRNSGSAFGLFPNQTLFLIIASLVAIVVMLTYYRRAARASQLVAISFGLQLGGAVSNLADRIRQGFVVDFVDFRVWPVFNAADAAITIGLVLLVVLLVLSDRAQRLERLRAAAEAERRAAEQGTLSPVASQEPTSGPTPP